MTSVYGNRTRERRTGTVSHSVSHFHSSPAIVQEPRGWLSGDAGAVSERIVRFAPNGLGIYRYRYLPVSSARRASIDDSTVRWRMTQGGGTPHCKVHGGGRRCQHLGCPKAAVGGGTPHCQARGGGRRCQHEGCSKHVAKAPGSVYCAMSPARAARRCVGRCTATAWRGPSHGRDQGVGARAPPAVAGGETRSMPNLRSSGFALTTSPPTAAPTGTFIPWPPLSVVESWRGGECVRVVERG
jgi:hypothetical protein